MGPDELKAALGDRALDNQQVANDFANAQFSSLMGSVEAGGVSSAFQEQMPEAVASASPVAPETTPTMDFGLS